MDSYNWSPGTEELQDAINVYWEQIGIRVKRTPIALPTFQGLSLAAIKDRWKNATLSTNFQIYYPIGAAVQPRFMHTPAGAFFFSGDPEATRLADAYVGATTLDGYIKAGREYQRYIHEHLTAAWPVIDVGVLYAGSNRLPNDWAPNLGGWINTARAAAVR